MFTEKPAPEQKTRECFTIVLLRHGESLWNQENRFTGWTDIDLSPQGIEEAHRAARLLIDGGFSFDITYTSVLRRAIRTLWIVLDDMDLMYLPVYHSWRLNERHYGALQGLDKRETTEKFGTEQVMAWRRGYAIQPPALAETDPRHRCLTRDTKAWKKMNCQRPNRSKIPLPGLCRTGKTRLLPWYWTKNGS